MKENKLWFLEGHKDSGVIAIKQKMNTMSTDF
jgi:hypothetical protein